MKKLKFCIRVSILCGLFLMTSCASKEADSSISEAPPAVKKQIKDTSYASKKEDIGPRKRLMILPFLDQSEARPQSLRDQARAEFIKDLNKSGEVIVVDTSDLKMDLTKSIKGSEGNREYNISDIAKNASQLGVNVVLEGKIMDLKVSRKSDPVGLFRQMKTKFEASVRVRMAAARSGNEIFNTVKTVTLEEAQTRVAENITADKLLQSNPELLEKLIADAFMDFEPQVLAALHKVSWEGRIAMISGDRVYLNVGKLSGVQIGDILKVSEEGDEVFDPQSGNFIGKSPGRLKGTLEVISYFGQDGAIAITHSGAGFKENDKIEQY